MRRLFAFLALLAALMFAVVACGGDEEGEEGTTPTGGGVSGSVSIMGIWVADEQASFQRVLDGFKEKFPDVDVKYNAAGNDLPTILSTAVEGGNPPDLAAIAQPAFVQQLVDQDALKPLDFAKETLDENFEPAVLETGTFDGKLYALFFKGNNKSTVWYNIHAFGDAGVEPPETWEDFLTAAETVKASGVPAYSIGGAEGWTLTDLFENIYLRTAGVEKYDQLSKHEIPWTDQSVKDALAEMAKIFSDADNLVGGTNGALQTDFPTSVSQVFSDPPKGAMVIEGDFVNGIIVDSTEAKPETDFNYFTFPSVNDSPSSVVAAGNLVVMLNDNPAARALLEYLATPEAAEIWIQRGGFVSPNKNVSEDAYADPLSAGTAQEFAQAEVFRYDLSDLVPAEFGATTGQGLWKLFQDFVQNPDDIDGIAKKMEDAAAAAPG